MDDSTSQAGFQSRGDDANDAALDASVSEVERMCNEYRWQQNADENSNDAENARSLKQIGARYFSWKTVSNGHRRPISGHRLGRLIRAWPVFSIRAILRNLRKVYADKTRNRS